MGVLTRGINGFSKKTNAFSVFQGETMVRALSPPVFHLQKTGVAGYSQTLALEWIQRGAVLRG